MLDSVKESYGGEVIEVVSQVQGRASIRYPEYHSFYFPSRYPIRNTFTLTGFKMDAWFSVWPAYGLYTHCMYTVSPVCGVLAVQFTADRGHDAPKNLKST